MIRITNEFNGKLYELVPETYICEGCDLKKKCNGSYLEIINGMFNGCNVCGKLHGIWREIKDEQTATIA